MVAINIKDIINNRKQLIELLVIVLAVIIAIMLLYKSYYKDDISISKTRTIIKNISKEIDPYFDISILESTRNISINSRRDLFRFHQEPPKVVNQPIEPPPPPPQEMTIKTEEEIAEELSKQEPPSMMSLKLFGILNRSNKQIYAFISDGKEIYVVTKDNIFANQFKVIYIDEEKIEIIALKNNYKKTLIFTGGKQT